jgi:hypothetical protein
MELHDTKMFLWYRSDIRIGHAGRFSSEDHKWLLQPFYELPVLNACPKKRPALSISRLFRPDRGPEKIVLQALRKQATVIDLAERYPVHSNQTYT